MLVKGATDDYFYNLLLLFIPDRIETELLCINTAQQYASAKDAFMANSTALAFQLLFLSCSTTSYKMFPLNVVSTDGQQC